MQGDLQYEIIHLFRCTDHVLKRAIGKKVEGTGLYRSQHRLLMILGSHPDCSQSAIAEKMEISPPAVAVALKKLEKGGYISRQCHMQDNRVNEIVVTEKGQKAIDESILCFQEINAAILEGFSPEEMEQLKGFLERMIANGERYYQSAQKAAQKRGDL